MIDLEMSKHFTRWLRRRSLECGDLTDRERSLLALAFADGRDSAIEAERQLKAIAGSLNGLSKWQSAKQVGEELREIRASVDELKKHLDRGL